VLFDLLIDCVDGGASLGFICPFVRHAARWCITGTWAG